MCYGWERISEQIYCQEFKMLWEKKLRTFSKARLKPRHIHHVKIKWVKHVLRQLYSLALCLLILQLDCPFIVLILHLISLIYTQIHKLFT